MTYAPADLLAVQRYLKDETGQEWSSLGVIHSTPQGGGYHEGQDLLIAAGRAPGPQYPGSDYSYTDAPSRDLAPPHDMSLRTAVLAGGDAASAFDLGGGFSRFLEFNGWMRARMLAGDPRTADIREMIYTLDRRTVRRIDRTGKQADGGDSSHLTHTHFSFFRDSLGRRDRDDNFLGLLREFFDGKTTTEVDDMAGEGPEILARLKEVQEMHIYGLGNRNSLGYWLRTFQEQQWANMSKKIDALAVTLTALAQAEKVDDAKLAEIKTAIANIGQLTPEEATAQAEIIGAMLVESGANGLSEADHDAIVADVQEAFRVIVNGPPTPADQSAPTT